MFASLSAPLAGTKRGVEDDTLNDYQPAAPGPAAVKEHRAGLCEHIDPRMLCCRTCPEVSCCETVLDSRPSKRRASSHKVAEFHVPADKNPITGLEQQFPDDCFSEFCQDCELEPACTSPCALPCPGDEQCSSDDACCDPHCEQVECLDKCADPACTKISCPADPCFCQKCDAHPCPLGDLESECHLAHTAPTTTGTIICYDNAPCHFQAGYHGFDPNLAAYETYPCFSPSHGTLSHSDTAQASNIATPCLSSANYTSLESTFSDHSSPIPGRESALQCFLNIPFDHCHFGSSCCHGSTRECEDDPTTSQNHFDVWNSTFTQNSGLENSFLNFGFQPSQPNGSLSLDMTTDTHATTFNNGLQNHMSSFDNSSWLFTDSHFPNVYQTSMPMPNDKLAFLASAVQDEVMKPITPKPKPSPLDNDLSSPSRSVTSNSNESSEICICKWQHSPNHTCNAVFDSPSTLHSHMKTSHVDSCTRCFCLWENCDSCSKDFKQRSKLSRHLLGHAGHRPYACTFEGCNKTFATNQAKDNHERTHTGDRPYKCDICGYTTTTHTQLQTHISALHLNHKPHKCRFCDFTCADSSNLSKHERTHQVRLRSSLEMSYPEC